MDQTSFLALYKASCASSRSVDIRRNIPPPLVMGTFVYLQGLGYDVVSSGRVAEEYIARCCTVGSGPRSHDGGTSRSIVPARMDTSREVVIDWSEMKEDVYSFVMDAEHPHARVETLSDEICLLDQISIRMCCLRGQNSGDDLVVHCDRHIFMRQEDELDYAELTGKGFDRARDTMHVSYTPCTITGVDSDGVLVLPSSDFIDPTFETFHGLKNICSLLTAYADAFCKGSSRCANTSADTRQGNQHRDVANDTRGSHDSTPDSRGPSSLRDTRVGYSDLDPIGRQGAGQGLGPGGMMVGPHHPIFGRGRLEPPEGHEGNLPPGARWDPIGPPGTRGFFPGDFQRRNTSGSNRGTVHPDIMQPGPSSSSDLV